MFLGLVYLTSKLCKMCVGFVLKALSIFGYFGNLILVSIEMGRACGAYG